MPMNEPGENDKLFYVQISTARRREHLHKIYAPDSEKMFMLYAPDLKAAKNKVCDHYGKFSVVLKDSGGNDPYVYGDNMFCTFYQQDSVEFLADDALPDTERKTLVVSFTLEQFAELVAVLGLHMEYEFYLKHRNGELEDQYGVLHLEAFNNFSVFIMNHCCGGSPYIFEAVTIDQFKDSIKEYFKCYTATDTTEVFMYVDDNPLIEEFGTVAWAE